MSVAHDLSGNFMAFGAGDALDGSSSGFANDQVSGHLGRYEVLEFS
jgi:hypothetical protein